MKIGVGYNRHLIGELLKCEVGVTSVEEKIHGFRRVQMQGVQKVAFRCIFLYPLDND
jgi:hypothetical protein